MKKSDNKSKGTSTSRREFLKKAGVTAALTPPAMVLLSRPSSATILKSGTGQGGDHRDYNPQVSSEKVAMHRNDGSHENRSHENRSHENRSH